MNCQTLDGFLLDTEQWGTLYNIASGSVITLPISATPFFVVPVDVNTDNNSLIFSITRYSKGSFTIYGNRRDGTAEVWGNWLAFCF